MKSWLVKKGLTFWISVATVAGIVAGYFLGEAAAVLTPLGDLFMTLIKMVIVPLVFLSITLGAASLDDVRKAGKIGIQAFSFYMITTVFAICIALFFGYIFEPGKGLDQKMLTAVQTELKTEETLPADESAEKIRHPGFIQILKSSIPENPLKAMFEMNILQVIFFSVFLGLCIAGLAPEHKKPVISVLEGFNKAFLAMVHAIMCTAPIGVFGLMAVTVGVFGFATLYLLCKLLLVYIFCAVFHFFVVYAGSLKLFTGLSPLKFIQKMEVPLLVSFTTASSLVTLPTSMETAENEFEVAPEISSFVLPLGATINMDGSAMNFGLYAIFGLQFFGMDLTLEKCLLIILTATLGSIGAAGVPGPSILTISVLNAAGVPLSVLPLYIATDRIFDMIRTSVNISGDITCAAVINHFNPIHHAPPPDVQHNAEQT